MRLLAALLSFCWPGWAAITVVNSNVCQQAVDTATVTCTLAVTTGNQLHVAVGFTNTGREITSITDNATGGSNTYGTAVSHTETANALLWVYCVSSLKTTETITVSVVSSPNNSTGVLRLLQFSGGSCTLDGTPVTTTPTWASTVLTCASIVTTNAADLIVASVQVSNGGTTSVWTGISPFTGAAASGYPGTGVLAYRIVSATGTYTPSVDEALVGGYSPACTVVAYKEAATTLRVAPIIL